MRELLPVLIAALATPLLPSPAQACGGFFCSSQPVEQNAERILFEIDMNGPTIAATVEIRYSGDADDFAWVVPVVELGDEPELEVAPGSLMTLLEGATSRSVFFPPTKCSTPNSPIGLERDVAILQPMDGGVEVDDLEQVGPYQPQRIRSDDADALVAWLNDNGYLITASMEPTVAEYVARGYDFLGMKLAPEAGVTDIQPIVIRYPGTEPMVPVVLTSVAAQPEMAIMTFISANTRWESSNYTNLDLNDDERMQADPDTGRDNYYALTRWLTDDADGHAFVTEFAGPSDDVQLNSVFLNSEDADEARAFAQAVLDRNSVFTRMTARLSGHEMTVDPTFAPSAGGAVSRTIDLSDRDAVEVCTNSRAAMSDTPCGSTYCGVGAQCATTEDGAEGCVCPEGHTARAIQVPQSLSNPTLVDTVTCLSSEDFLADVVGTVDGPADPCAANLCGSDGVCLAVNGFATCDCNDGFAAVPNGVGAQTCSAVVETFEPTQILWSDSGCSSCSTASRSGGSMWLLLVALVAVRRRS
jgi:hypothetical protein